MDTMREERQYRITTRHPEGKSGISIDRETYTLVSDYIVSVLRKEHVSTLALLIDKAVSYFPSINNWTLSNYLFWIKLDLEAKGVIKNVYRKNGRGLQSFRLARKWMNKNTSMLREALVC